MISFEPKELNQKEVHRFMLGGIAPRPIALVSTISSDEILNLSPFSFYNAFGSNPPIIAFSPARRGRDNTLKDTYNNLMANGECVVNAVTEFIIDQINLASAEFPPNINEFEKSGLTPIDSDMIKPKRVKESPYQMECKMLQMVHTGESPGAANIAVCEVVKFHIADEIIREGTIHPDLIRHIGRNGANFYTKAYGEAIFSLEKPPNKPIGYDSIPKFLLHSNVLTANNLAKLALSESQPTLEESIKYFDSFEKIDSNENTFWIYFSNKDLFKTIACLKHLSNINHSKASYFFELTIKMALELDEINSAWLLAVYKGMKYDF